MLQELAQGLKKNNPELYLLVLEGWTRDFARMVVVLALHAGTKTSDDAARYLVDTLGVPREEASREVLEASVSPAIAYPAISMILVEDMLKNVSYVFGYEQASAGAREHAPAERPSAVADCPENGSRTRNPSRNRRSLRRERSRAPRS